MNNRINILNVLVSNVNFEIAVQKIVTFDYKLKNGYVCLPDLSVIVAAQSDNKLLKILNNSSMTLPDGKPLEFIAKIKGNKVVSTVSGYWLIKRLLNENLKHYFYGGSEKTLSSIKRKFSDEYKKGIILGFKSPPLIGIDEIENSQNIKNDIEEIISLNPDIIWVGLSSPKQDYLISYYSSYLDHGLMIAVGGVFDYLGERKKISPEWIKKIGLRWLYRLAQEPGRLWGKYFKTITGVIMLTCKYLFKKLKNRMK